MPEPLDTYLRPEVKAFALAMETVLRSNDYKGGWKDSGQEYLRSRLNEERIELTEMVLLRPDDKVSILVEAADVANFAMMVADVMGALQYA